MLQKMIKKASASQPITCLNQVLQKRKFRKPTLQKPRKPNAKFQMLHFSISMVTRIMVERAIVIGTKLGNKFDNYIHYLEHVWQDNPMIMDFLQQVAVLASSSASIERVFSFFHRQTSYFLRRAISSATLSSMAYIYIEEILEEMHQWDGKNYIRSGLDKFLYDEIDLLPDLQEEQEEHAQNEQAEEENNMNEESDWIHGDFQPDE
ncbi:Hypothetical_protein [Hexamita inflata]|uniref:Hypothetical_protein n=1 Tax=Hexamita inflata TaxID=28002 RepID=A0AA86RFC9_9EUKA|nr:Hypothetical protein HINF_LOCUS64596 [Hexamita inflata]